MPCCFSFKTMTILSCWAERECAALLSLKWGAANITDRIEMGWIPAKIAPCFLAAQLLIHRITARPFTEFRRRGVSGNDFRFAIARTEPSLDRACDKTHRAALDRRADVAFPADAVLDRQSIELREIPAMNQRPSHILATDDANRVSF